MTQEIITKEVSTQTHSDIVTSTKDVDFPSLNWGISAGEKKELPKDKEAQDAILALDFITKVK